jgi:hypothetical protein
MRMRKIGTYRLNCSASCTRVFEGRFQNSLFSLKFKKLAFVSEKNYTLGVIYTN